jgi:hypothetical protein
MITIVARFQYVSHECDRPIAMVGILGVLRDTPDYKRFQRAGRLIENAKYSGDSGIRITGKYFR